MSSIMMSDSDWLDSTGAPLWARVRRDHRTGQIRETGPCDHIPSTIDICPPGAKCQFNWKPNPEHQACVAALAQPKEAGIPGWVWAVAGAAVAILLVRR